MFAKLPRNELAREIKKTVLSVYINNYIQQKWRYHVKYYYITRSLCWTSDNLCEKYLLTSPPSRAEFFSNNQQFKSNSKNKTV